MGWEATRDTDADWRELGATQPYWGVLSHPDYRMENLTPEALEAFYASGRNHVDDILARFEQLFGGRPAGAALDFGCGAGRLTEPMAEPMAERMAEATGCDVAPGMLDLARRRGGKALYVGALPDGPFDWVNSFIVLQHIPPARGLGLVEALLARLAPGGFASLHMTLWREPHLQPQPAPRWRRLAQGLRAGPPVGSISMYDYELSGVVKVFTRAGLGELHLVPTDHGGHHGAIVLGRRGGASS
ncbi:class I SAM-dependent methyltransferase [Phenylobacterium sp.]|jgi:SAM-dependent methyltransferase|uniref:class I SAM-dependent methyltransferase n=1 Tax=Phenylobacterium sp. TaxID=1871053 RepID=UPI002F3EEAEF